MPDFMTQPYGGFSPGLGPMGSRPVRNVQTRNVNSQVGIDVPLPPPNPMREVQQPTQPVQPMMGVPGDQGYANPALADALLAMSQQGADSPIEAIGNIAAAWASQRQRERAAQYEAQKAERERQREMQMYEKKRQDALTDHRAKLGIEQEFGGGASEYGLSPVYGTDAQGNPVILQLNKAGGARQVPLPDGVGISTGMDKVDLGNAWGLYDKRSGEFKGTVPKDLAGAERDKAVGKAQGEGIVDLPGSLQKAEQTIAVIDQMLQHPGRETATGMSGTLDPRNYIPGTDATNFHTMNRQLAGKAFLEAFDSLKGGGHITEIEGEKATEAMARLSTAQSDEAYKQSLLELRGIIAKGMRSARARAGQDASGAPPVAPPPETGADTPQDFDRRSLEEEARRRGLL